LPWFSGDAFGQWLDFNVGIRSNILELQTGDAQRLSTTCREYQAATTKCRLCFVMGWMAAVAIPFFWSFQQTLATLGVATWVVICWGVLPKWSLPDRTQDAEFLCRSHVHVYTYFPGDDKIDACYYCVCGKTEKARD
jgi:hypothetical protein